MALSAFDDRSHEPCADDLQEVLGRAFALWERLVAHVQTEFAPAAMDWTFSGAKWGWALRLKQKKRAVLYMTPCRRHFVVGFALGEKALRVARKSDLPHSVMSTVEGSVKFAEGRAVRLEVRTRSDLEHVKVLAAIRMAN